MKVTADDVAQLLASPPPRRVSRAVYKAALGNRGAWVLAIFGVVFGGVGVLFMGIFFPWRCWDEWRLSGPAALTVSGVVQTVRETSMSINETRVMVYDFRYTTPGGRTMTGHCYSTGALWSERSVVTVRYLPTQPELACIQGARLSESGWGGAFVVVFPLLGGGMMAGCIISRRRTRYLLEQGHVTEVNVVSVNETNTKVNYQSVYRIVVSGPELAGGQPVTVKRVNKPEVNLALKRARDHQSVYVLHDPRRPQRLLFPEAWVAPEA